MFIPPFITLSIHPFSTSPLRHHLPVSHHQYSQGDERHREEGLRGINFSHGWESSSQKTWQPQTAWLKKKRRGEERRAGGWAQEEKKGGGGILHMMALREGFWILGVFFSLYPKPPCLGWEWANCSSCSLSSTVLTSWKMWVGTSAYWWLLPGNLEMPRRNQWKWFTECLDPSLIPLAVKNTSAKSNLRANANFLPWFGLTAMYCLFISHCHKPCAVIYICQHHITVEGRHWQTEAVNHRWLKLLVFKWQGALFPLTLSQINWASQVCLWERGEKNQNKRSHWSEDGRRGWLSSLANGPATQPSRIAGYLIPPILSR